MPLLSSAVCSHPEPAIAQVVVDKENVPLLKKKCCDKGICVLKDQFKESWPLRRGVERMVPHEEMLTALY